MAFSRRFLSVLLSLCAASSLRAERGPTLDEGKAPAAAAAGRRTTASTPAAAPARVTPAGGAAKPAPPLAAPKKEALEPSSDDQSETVEATTKEAPVSAPPLAQEAETRDAAALPFFELFGNEQAPGSGTLEASFGDRKESVVLGSASGYYGHGIFFSGRQLPAQARKEVSEQVLLQVSFGSLRNRLQGQVPQFLSVTLALPTFPAESMTVPIAEPGPRETVKNRAFLLYTSPQTPNDRSDEEKLKSTYFAQSGAVRLRPVGGERVSDGKVGRKTYSFRMRLWELSIDGVLSTPFSPAPGKLVGKVLVPVYRPNGKSSEELLARIAAESFESLLTAQSSGNEGGRDGRNPRREPSRQKPR